MKSRQWLCKADAVQDDLSHVIDEISKPSQRSEMGEVFLTPQVGSLKYRR